MQPILEQVTWPDLRGGLAHILWEFAAMVMLLVMIDAYSVQSFGQLISGPELVKAGPSGRPVLIMDEVGNWSGPLLISSDSEADVFVPANITTEGWAQWNVERFRESGTFLTRIYTFLKNDHVCRRVFIPAGHKDDPKYLAACKTIRYRAAFAVIDTRLKTISLQNGVFIMKTGLCRYFPITRQHQSRAQP